MLDYGALRDLVRRDAQSPLFLTVSGAHLYGFPSPDSDIDLRGSHLLPLREVVGLVVRGETIERKLDLAGIEVELVTHDLGKYLRLLLKNNGYILEQIFSPFVVCGQDFLEELRPIARRCITRHHYHHYRGFLDTQRKLLARQDPKTLKTLLYAYRVLLTGIHLLRTGEVEANLPRLADVFGCTFLGELIAQKGEESAEAHSLDWSFHDAELTRLEARLEAAFDECRLGENRDHEAVNHLLVRWRLRCAAPGGATSSP